MKLGLQVVAFNWPGSPANTGRTLFDIAQAADGVGFASLWVMDHYFQIEPGIGQASDPMLEAYTALSFIAGATQRIRLGAMVTGVIYRQPAFLVKQVSTLDVLSGGRANLGIGAAWYEREAVGWASLTRRRPSASSGWRRPCRSPNTSGRATLHPMKASTIGCQSRSTARSRCRSPIRRS